MWRALLIVFAFAVLYKLIINSYKYWFCKKMKKEHIEWANGNNDNFPTYKIKIISMFKDAGVRSVKFPVSEATGNYMVATYNADVFTNFPSLIEKVFLSADKMFNFAIGVFRSRIFDAINPLYWIDLIIFAPKHFIEYLDFDMDKFAPKLCNVVLTFVWWTISALFITFKEQIFLLVSNLFQQIG